MMMWSSLVLALRHMARNPMRSFLTTLGILIGVAAVIAMVSLGRGATARVEHELSSLGHNLLFVMPGSRANGPQTTVGAARPFTLADGQALARQVPNVAAVAPAANRGIIAQRGGLSWRTMITGSDGAYLQVLNWDLAQGRWLSDPELSGGAAVAVLGDRVRRELFGAEDPIGGMITMGGVAYRVVGVFAPKGQSTFGQDQDDFVLVPLRTFQRRVTGNSRVSLFFVSATSSEATPQVQRDIVELLRERRHLHTGEVDDFQVHDMKEVQNMIGGITGILTALLAAIAAVSLVVGGIGIMNIMLVAVTERTREIGIRLAIGARTRDVLMQFMVEAVVLSGMGGLLGVATGIGASAAIARGLGLPFVVDETMAVIALAFSTLVGVIFGAFPARKAARLQPIEALRYE